MSPYESLRVARRFDYSVPPATSLYYSREEHHMFVDITHAAPSSKSAYLKLNSIFPFVTIPGTILEICGKTQL